MCLCVYVGVGFWTLAEDDDILDVSRTVTTSLFVSGRTKVSSSRTEFVIRTFFMVTPHFFFQPFVWFY